MKHVFAKVGNLVTCAILVSSASGEEAAYQVQPMITRYAETAEKITFNTSVRAFKDVKLEEADGFDGWTVDADLTVPFLSRFQLRAFMPIYTEGEARLIEPGTPDRGRKIDIDGTGGVFDFPSLMIEAQLLAEKDHGINLAVFGGAGAVLDFNTLDTTEVVEDVYNHKGRVGLFGVKADWRCGDRLRFLGNLGGRYYWESDDINPAESGDSFSWLDASVAAVMRPWNIPVYPVAELVYQGDVTRYHSVLAVPEVVCAINSHLELKAGVPIGLTHEGEQVGARFQATLRF